MCTNFARMVNVWILQNKSFKTTYCQQRGINKRGAGNGQDRTSTQNTGVKFFFTVNTVPGQKKNEESGACFCGHENVCKVSCTCRYSNRFHESKIELLETAVVYRKPVQVSNFGGSFDQLFLRIFEFLRFFTQDAHTFSGRFLPCFSSIFR